MALIDYNNGTATISVNGGQPPFSYLLTQNGSAATHNGANFVNPIVSSSQSVVFGDASDMTGSYGLPAGTYKCIITDDNGCSVTTSDIVISNTPEATTTQATAATTQATAATTLATNATTLATNATTLATPATTLATNATTLATPATTLATNATTLATAATTLATAATTLATPATTLATAATTLATPATTLATAATTLATAATTLATPATTLATNATTLATTIAPLEHTFYHLHAGGGSVAPYSDLSAGGTFYLSTGLSTQSIGVLMADLIQNGDGQTNGNGVAMPSVNSFEFSGPITGNDCGQSWESELSSGLNFFWLAVPNNTDFTENLITDGVLQYDCNGQPYNANNRTAFTYENQQYWLYKLAAAPSSNAQTYGFK